jgi:hypothetical protein
VDKDYPPPAPALLKYFIKLCYKLHLAIALGTPLFPNKFVIGEAELALGALN